jgi:hypothetical protein
MQAMMSLSFEPGYRGETFRRANRAVMAAPAVGSADSGGLTQLVLLAARRAKSE